MVWTYFNTFVSDLPRKMGPLPDLQNPQAPKMGPLPEPQTNPKYNIMGPLRSHFGSSQMLVVVSLLSPSFLPLLVPSLIILSLVLLLVLVLVLFVSPFTCPFACPLACPLALLSRTGRRTYSFLHDFLCLSYEHIQFQRNKKSRDPGNYERLHDEAAAILGGVEDPQCSQPRSSTK